MDKHRIAFWMGQCRYWRRSILGWLLLSGCDWDGSYNYRPGLQRAAAYYWHARAELATEIAAVRNGR